jgi:large subunit ribosomal protein L30
MADLRITQIKSKIGYPRDQRATLQSLGLRKIRQQVIRPDNPAVRGMIQKVRHLVTVEEAD